MSKNIVIELTDNVVDKVRQAVKDDSGLPLQTKEVTAKRVELIMKNYFSSAEQMRMDMFPLMMRSTPDRVKAVEKVIDDYSNTPVKATVSVDENTVEVKVTSSYAHPLMRNNKPLLHFMCEDGKPTPTIYDGGYVNKVEFNTKKIGELCDMVREIMAFLDKPTTVQTVTNTKQPIKPKTSSKKKVNRKKANVRYVYKTVYKVTNVGANATTGRKQYAEREWNKEEWTRQGHYRTYRSKTTGQIIKQIWIEPTVCRAHGKVKENQNLKITKMD